MTLLIDKKDCECDEDGIIWDKDHQSYYYCPQHSVEGSKDIGMKEVRERVEKIERFIDKFKSLVE